jgi:hypothetical protein
MTLLTPRGVPCRVQKRKTRRKAIGDSSGMVRGGQSGEYLKSSAGICLAVQAAKSRESENLNRPEIAGTSFTVARRFQLILLGHFFVTPCHYRGVLPTAEGSRGDGGCLSVLGHICIYQGNSPPSVAKDSRNHGVRASRNPSRRWANRNPYVRGQDGVDEVDDFV